MGYLLHHTAATLHRQADQILQEQLGIGMSQFKILTLLQEGALHQRQIAGQLAQTEASISRQAKLLVEKGMVQAHINPQNRREHVTLLTSKGMKITQAASDILATFHEPVFDMLSPKQKQQLVVILQDLHRDVCHEGKPHACGHAQE